MPAFPKAFSSIIALGLGLLIIMLITGPSLAVGIRAIGSVTEMGNGWYTAVCYNPSADQYLALWRKYSSTEIYADLHGRRICADTGEPSGLEFTVGQDCGLGAPVYNSVLECWFVVYSTDHDFGANIYGQKVGSNGNIGGPIPMVIEDRDQAKPCIAYNPTNNRFLLVWTDMRGDRKNIRGRMFDQDGNTITGLSEILISDYTTENQSTAKVTYNPLTNEFVVVWIDQRNLIYRVDPNENNDPYMDIYGQIVDAENSTLIGDDIPIWTPYNPPESYVADGQDIPEGLSCNTNENSVMYGTYFIAIKKRFTQAKGLILNSDGSHFSNLFDVSTDTGSWTGLVYNPNDDSYATSYKSENDIYGRLFSANGLALCDPQKIIAHPDYEENFGDLAIRPTDGQCFQTTTWFEHLITHERPYIQIGQRFKWDIIAPQPVTNFIATPDSRSITLNWINPTDTDFSGTIIRYSTTEYPSNQIDGILLVDNPNAPGSNDSYPITWPLPSASPLPLCKLPN